MATRAIGEYNIDNVTPDTASNPDDTTLVAAPTQLARIYLKWISISVETAQASSFIDIEDGVGGQILFRVNSSAVGAYYRRWDDGADDGFPCTAETLLNAQVSGATGVVASITGKVVIR